MKNSEHSTAEIVKDTRITTPGTNSQIVQDFIHQVWNSGALDRIHEFVADDYHDFSFLPTVPPNRDGLRFWIENTSRAFDHTTAVESIVGEDDHVAVRISFTAKHIGPWRNIQPTLRTVTVKGFRFFQLKDGKIFRHWALIDGEALQTALTDEYQGCELPNVSKM